MDVVFVIFDRIILVFLLSIFQGPLCWFLYGGISLLIYDKLYREALKLPHVINILVELVAIFSRVSLVSIFYLSCWYFCGIPGHSCTKGPCMVVPWATYKLNVHTYTYIILLVWCLFFHCSVCHSTQLNSHYHSYF